MRECLGKHSCMSSPFPIAILNGPFFFRFLKAMNNWKLSGIKQILLTNYLTLFPAYFSSHYILSSSLRPVFFWALNAGDVFHSHNITECNIFCSHCCKIYKYWEQSVAKLNSKTKQIFGFFTVMKHLNIQNLWSANVKLSRHSPIVWMNVLSVWNLKVVLILEPCMSRSIFCSGLVT